MLKTLVPILLSTLTLACTSTQGTADSPSPAEAPGVDPAQTGSGVVHARLWVYPPTVDLAAAEQSLVEARWFPIERSDCLRCASADRQDCEGLSCAEGQQTIFAVRSQGQAPLKQGRIWVYDTAVDRDQAAESRRSGGWVDVAQQDCLQCTEAGRSSCDGLSCFEGKVVVFSVRLEE